MTSQARIAIAGMAVSTVVAVGLLYCTIRFATDGSPGTLVAGAGLGAVASMLVVYMCWRALHGYQMPARDPVSIAFRVASTSALIATLAPPLVAAITR